MTKEQILAAIELALAGKTPAEYKDGYITTVKELNAGKGLKFWKGTQADFLSLGVDASCFFARIDKDGNVYMFTDDTYFSDLVENTVEQATQAAANAAASVLGSKQDLHTAVDIALYDHEWQVEQFGDEYDHIPLKFQRIPVDGLKKTDSVIIAPAGSTQLSALRQFELACIQEEDGYLTFTADPDANIEGTLAFRAVILPSIGRGAGASSGYENDDSVTSFTLNGAYTYGMSFFLRSGGDIYFRTAKVNNQEIDGFGWEYIEIPGVPSGAILESIREVCTSEYGAVMHTSSSDAMRDYNGGVWQIPASHYDQGNPNSYTHWEGHFIVRK
jgi:hypothetical protein